MTSPKTSATTPATSGPDSERQQGELQVLLDTIADLTSTLSVTEVLERLLDRTLHHLQCEIGSILRIDEDGTMRIALARGLPAEVIRETRLQLGEGISGHVAASSESVLISDIESDTRFGRENRERYYTHSLISAPLELHGVVLGVINVNNKKNREAFTEQDRRLLEAIATHAAVALQNAHVYEEMLERAQCDSLTGLSNHGHFWSSLDVELDRARRYERTASLVMIDVDHFKSYNDAHGHVAGDQVLAVVARLLRQSCRTSDLAARYGGDEFALVLPETGREGASAFGEKIRRTIEEGHGQSDPELPLSVSVGVAVYPDDAGSARSLVEVADHRLYLAKSRGRNQVCAEG